MNNSICVVFIDLNDFSDTILRKRSSITITLRFETCETVITVIAT